MNYELFVIYFSVSQKTLVLRPGITSGVPLSVMLQNNSYYNDASLIWPSGFVNN
jgi:hypothetical protein